MLRLLIGLMLICHESMRKKQKVSVVAAITVLEVNELERTNIKYFARGGICK